MLVEEEAEYTLEDDELDFGPIARKHMMAALEHASTFKYADAISAGACSAVIYAYDRLIMRDPFIRVVMDSTRLQNMLGRLHALLYMKMLMESEKVDKEKLDDTIKELTEYCEKHRNSLIERMKLVAKTPKAEDTVN